MIRSVVLQHSAIIREKERLIHDFGYPWIIKELHAEEEPRIWLRQCEDFTHVVHLSGGGVILQVRIALRRHLDLHLVHLAQRLLRGEIYRHLHLAHFKRLQILYQPGRYQLPIALDHQRNLFNLCQRFAIDLNLQILHTHLGLPLNLFAQEHSHIGILRRLPHAIPNDYRTSARPNRRELHVDPHLFTHAPGNIPHHLR